jgi:hypothetical protein
MTQASLVVAATQSGTAFTAALNAALAAVNSCHEGSTAPTQDVVNGKLWIDSSASTKVLNIYWSGAWRPVLTYSGGVITLATGISLAGLASTVTELNYVDNVTGPIQTQLNGKQASSTILSNIAAILSGTTGFLTKTGPNSVAARSITAGTGITITNPKGIAGDVVISSSSSFSKFYVSSPTVFNYSTSYTFAHGLGDVPLLLNGSFICKIGTYGFTVGTEVQFHLTTLTFGMFADDTNIYLKLSATYPATTYAPAGSTMGFDKNYWNLIVRAWL